MTEGEIRVGIGFDIHRMEDGVDLKIAGVEIPFERGAVARTDGDVVLHAVIDAMLGAAALGDIGGMFPEDDDRFLGADSAMLLDQALKRVTEAGYSIVNVDVNVIAERPRLRPYFEAMRDRLSVLLDVDKGRVNVKARSAEGLGPIGESRALASQVVVLLRGKSS